MSIFDQALRDGERQISPLLPSVRGALAFLIEVLRRPEGLPPRTFRFARASRAGLRRPACRCCAPHRPGRRRPNYWRTLPDMGQRRRTRTITSHVRPEQDDRNRGGGTAHCSCGPQATSAVHSIETGTPCIMRKKEEGECASVARGARAPRLDAWTRGAHSIEPHAHGTTHRRWTDKG
eukprot:scaffold35853_cov140-Isochrysis_galbana.AAC.2